jgi:glycosyltransferase involved in cell wall biosynthesis
MKLLYVIDSLAPGGAERSFGSMLPGYEARGVDVHVAYLTERAGLHDDYLAGGATLHPPNGGGRISSVRHLVELIRGIRPDLVHTTLFEADVAGRTAAALTRVPSVTSLVNETYGDEHRADPSLSPVRLLGAQTVDVVTCRFARRFHAVSEHVATTMARHLLIRRDRIDVVPRGRDPATLGVRSDERRRRVRNELGLEPLDTLVLAVARNEYQKGLDVLVASMPEILATVPSARVMVAGRPGAETESLREEAVRLGRRSRGRVRSPLRGRRVRVAVPPRRNARCSHRGHGA